MSFFGASRPLVNDAADIEVGNLPSDSTSALAWSPTADLLAVSSWSNQVRIYEVNGQGQAQGKAEYSHEGPALCVDWSSDGMKCFSGGADKAARMLDVSTGQSTQVGAHDAPIKCVKYLSGPNVLATASWDKTLKYWDTRSPTAVGTVPLAERAYALDAAGQLLVVGTANRKIQIINLANPTQIFKTMDSPLRWQTRTIACFPDSSGYALGTIEGRVAIQHVDDAKASSNFTFKCHRKDNPAPSKSSTVYAVNAISFHPYGTFSTAGSDGTINNWDKESKTRLKTFDNKGGPIVATGFNHTGRIFAYAVSQDWSGGHATNRPDFINKVFLHPCKDDEVKKRPKK